MQVSDKTIDKISLKLMTELELKIPLGNMIPLGTFIPYGVDN